MIEAPACSLADASIDAANPTKAGGNLFGSRGPLGQTLTIGAAGNLTGIELLVGSYSAAAGTSVELSVFDADDILLASAEVPIASLPASIDDLSFGEEVGAGYFDLSDACVAVQAGQQLRLAIDVVDQPALVCDQQTHQCSHDGSFCFDDFECASDAGLRQGTPYAGGHAIYNDGQEFVGVDFAFRVFVDP